MAVTSCRSIVLALVAAFAGACGTPRDLLVVADGGTSVLAKSAADSPATRHLQKRDHLRGRPGPAGYWKIDDGFVTASAVAPLPIEVEEKFTAVAEIDTGSVRFRMGEAVPVARGTPPWIPDGRVAIVTGGDLVSFFPASDVSAGKPPSSSAVAAVRDAVRDGALDRALTLARTAHSLDPTDAVAGRWLYALLEGTVEARTMSAFSPEQDPLPPLPAAATPGLTAFVAVPELALRKTPSDAAPWLARLHADDAVEILAVSGSWAQVRAHASVASRSILLDALRTAPRLAPDALAGATWPEASATSEGGSIEGWLWGGSLAASKEEPAALLTRAGSTADLRARVAVLARTVSLSATHEAVLAWRDAALAADDAHVAIGAARWLADEPPHGVKIEAVELFEGCRGERPKARPYDLASADGPPPDSCAKPAVRASHVVSTCDASDDPPKSWKTRIAREESLAARSRRRFEKSFTAPGFLHVRVRNTLPIAARARSLFAVEAVVPHPDECGNALGIEAIHAARLALPPLSAGEAIDLWLAIDPPENNVVLLSSHAPTAADFGADATWDAKGAMAIGLQCCD